MNNKNNNNVKARIFVAVSAKARKAGPMKDRRLKRKNRNSWRRDLD